MKEKLKFLFQDKTVIPVYAFCCLFHAAIWYTRGDLFCCGWIWPTFLITLTNIGVTFCIFYAIKKWKGGNRA